jgi:uncharacterized protein YndB with AHSA1/START domain
MKRNIHIVKEYPYAVATLWEAITTSEHIAEWLMPNDFEAKVGHRFTLRTKPAPGFDGIVHGEVLALEPERRMVWHWRGGPVDTTLTLHCESLGPKRCRLTLQHDGFTGAGALFASVFLHLGWSRKLLRSTLPGGIVAPVEQELTASASQKSNACAR